MDFVRHFVAGGNGAPSRAARSEEFFLRFSKWSTVFWAAALVFVAYLSRKVEFVLNAAFSSRGLTSGALLGGVLLAVFMRRGRSLPVVVGMIAALVVMTVIEVFPKWKVTKELWFQVVGTQIIWPWYTLIGVTVMLTVTWLTRALAGDKSAGPQTRG